MESQRRTSQLRRARGTGRVVPRATENPMDIVDSSNASTDDPLGKSRVVMPYQPLLDDHGPHVEITRLPMTSNVGTSDHHRHKYYERLHNVIVNALNINVEHDEIVERRLRNRRLRQEGVDVHQLMEDEEVQTFDFLLRPAHIIRPEFYQIHFPIEKEHHEGDKQSSLVTIMSIWNTMVGSSLLAVPWAMSLSGIVAGPLVAIVIALVAAFTANLIRVVHKKHSGSNGVNSIPEFGQLCGVLLGPSYEIIASLMSLAAVGGAAVVYWILMTNFAYNTVTYIYDSLSGSEHFPMENSTDVICPGPPTFINSTTDLNVNHSMPLLGIPSPSLTSTPMIANDTTTANESVFDDWWNMHNVSIYLVILLPLISMKSVTFFTKLNSIGTVTVVFLSGMILYFAFKWGLHVDLNNPDSDEYVPLVLPTFFCLSGMLSLGMFIHNAVITITSNNRHEENNARDLCIAFALVFVTYMLVGVAFYITFPLPKHCISDNLLNNFHMSNPLIFVCKALLLMQLITVFPLIMYILRNQVCLLLLKHDNPTTFFIVVINLIVLTVCILVSIFFPSIGTVIRFSGSGCGLVLIFFLPCLCHFVSMTRAKESKPVIMIVEACIVVLGILNFAAQFIPFLIDFDM